MSFIASHIATAFEQAFPPPAPTPTATPTPTSAPAALANTGSALPFPVIVGSAITLLAGFVTATLVAVRRARPSRGH